MASAHLTLHEAHCLLFLALCPECKEPVPQGKMDEHREKGHQQVRRPEGRGGAGGEESRTLAAPCMPHPSVRWTQPFCPSHWKLSLPLVVPCPALSLQAYGFGRGEGSLFQERLNVLLRSVKRGSRKGKL